MKRCPTCREPMTMWGHPDFAVPRCEPCYRSGEVFFEASGSPGADADDHYHEMAHHIVLFRKLPKKRDDWRLIGDVLEDYTAGCSQLHELRVRALEYVVFQAMGWRPSIKALVSATYSSLDDVNERNGGKKIVKTESQAIRIARGFAKKASPRNVRMLIGVIQRARNSEDAA